MGKSDRKQTIKKVAKATRKAVARPRAKAALNGSGRGTVKAKKLIGKPARRGKSRQQSIVLPEGYRPSETEPFMNERQRVYFRNKLVGWKEEIVRQNRETLQVLHEDSAQHADLADRATSETDRALELRARDRQRKLIAKIDAALMRIEEGTYGYCEETGEPIGLKRLDARPIATLSLEAQERHERREKVFREQ
jgi:DnaK suppressor protein